MQYGHLGPKVRLVRGTTPVDPSVNKNYHIPMMHHRIVIII